jgi:hypothetical protein
MCRTALFVTVQEHFIVYCRCREAVKLFRFLLSPCRLTGTSCPELKTSLERMGQTCKFTYYFGRGVTVWRLRIPVAMYENREGLILLYTFLIRNIQKHIDFVTNSSLLSTQSGSPLKLLGYQSRASHTWFAYLAHTAAGNAKRLVSRHMYLLRP